MDNSEGVDTTTSPVVNTSDADSVKNLKAEMNRKLSKVTQQLERAVSLIEARGTVPAVEADEDVPVTKTYVDSQFVKQGQEKSWKQALELFPELDQESDKFDEKFFKAADGYFAGFDLKKDPEAPLKAVKLAAIESGKIEQLAKEKLLKDESRRSRIIAEGSAAPREQRKEKEPTLNSSALARLGIKADDMKAHLKANKSKYGEE